jgi:hypothetical protein
MIVSVDRGSAGAKMPDRLLKYPSTSYTREPQAKSSDAGDKPFEDEYAASCKGIQGVACTGDEKREMNKALFGRLRWSMFLWIKSLFGFAVSAKQGYGSHYKVYEDLPAHSLQWISINRSLFICFVITSFSECQRLNGIIE